MPLQAQLDDQRSQLQVRAREHSGTLKLQYTQERRESSREAAAPAPVLAVRARSWPTLSASLPLRMQESDSGYACLRVRDVCGPCVMGHGVSGVSMPTSAAAALPTGGDGGSGGGGGGTIAASAATATPAMGSVGSTPAAEPAVAARGADGAPPTPAVIAAASGGGGASFSGIISGTLTKRGHVRCGRCARWCGYGSMQFSIGLRRRRYRRNWLRRTVVLSADSFSYSGGRCVLVNTWGWLKWSIIAADGKPRKSNVKLTSGSRGARRSRFYCCHLYAATTATTLPAQKKGSPGFYFKYALPRVLPPTHV